MKLAKGYRLNLFQHGIALLIGLVTLLVIYASFAWLVQAAGSGTLYPSTATGSRGNIEWRTSFYGGNGFLRRRALLKVYAEAGEHILLGSSAVGINNGDIRVYNPNTVTGPVGDETIPATSDFSCAAQRAATGNTSQGQIINRDQELAGPDTITDPATATPGNVVVNGYVPCYYTAPTPGIYYVVFLGPLGDNSNTAIQPTGSIPDVPNNFNDQQGTSISTWDVTVRPDLTSTTTHNGRLFADYLAFFTGDNPRLLNFTLYILTTDGYVYQTDLRELDPNGFIIYANDVGFLNSDGTPLYRDIVGDSDQLENLTGGVSLALPSHLIFLEPPSPEAIQANGITLTPQVPHVDSIIFEGFLGGDDTFVSAGGVFTYSSNISGTYEIVISHNKVNFDPTDPLNRVLRGKRSDGVQNIPWDGLDNTGNPFPPGLNYPISITVRAGEYHFPLLDVENSQAGGPQYTLLNPPGGNCPSFYGSTPNCHIAFYDDRGYITANSTTVGTDGATLPGNSQPNPNRSDPLQGFDTTNGQRAFGNGTTTGFGNEKGLDLWTHYPSQPQGATLDIYSFNLALAKTDGGITVAAGDTITYTLTYTHTGSVDATGVVITETVPVGTTFNATASLPTLWSCADGSASGTTCVTNLNTVAQNTSGTVTFAATVDDPLSSQIGQIDNSATIGDDGTNGPEPTDDNTATETTPTTLAIVDPIITKRATPDQALPGELVYFNITVFNPAPPSNTSATGVILIEPLPPQLDLVNYSIGDPAGLVDSVVDSTNTITVDIGVLGLNQSVTLYITATVNNLASPQPFTINNTAYLEFTEGPPRQGTASLRVPSSNPAPNPGDTDKDDDDDDDDDPSSSPPPAAPQPPAAQPTAALPVLFLPETGVGTSEGSANTWLVIPFLAATLLTVYVWQRTKKTK